MKQKRKLKTWVKLFLIIVPIVVFILLFLIALNIAIDMKQLKNEQVRSNEFMKNYICVSDPYYWGCYYEK